MKIYELKKKKNLGLYQGIILPAMHLSGESHYNMAEGSSGPCCGPLLGQSRSGAHRIPKDQRERAWG